MAPGLKGEHLRLQCPTCRYRFSVDATRPPAERFAVCPNCGEDHVAWDSGENRPADAVSIVPLDGDVQRWDVIAIGQHGRKNHEWIVKRVVGLAGEKIAIADGEVVVDGKPAVKPRRVQKALQIPLFDSAFYPAEERLVASRCRLFYRPNDDGSPPDRHPPSGDWKPLSHPSGVDLVATQIAYRHRPGYRTRHESERRVTPQDDCPYNQNLARSLHDVDQVRVRLDLRMESSTEFFVAFPMWHARVTGGRSRDGKIATKLVVAGRTWTGESATDRTSSSQKISMEVANIDRQWVVAVNDQITVTAPADSVDGADRDPPSTSEPMNESEGEMVVVGGAGSAVALERIRIWRDVYYFDDVGSFSPPGRVVPEGCVMVLGDNVPVSDDSRHWNPHWVRRQEILGRVEVDSSGSDD